MAYVFGFPSDVTAIIYSMRDPKNWNGDKYRRGSTRPAADWIYGPNVLPLNLGLTVFVKIRTSRYMGVYPNYTIFEFEHGNAFPERKKVFRPYLEKPVQFRPYLTYPDKELDEMWFQCEACEQTVIQSDSVQPSPTFGIFSPTFGEASPTQSNLSSKSQFS